MCWGDLGHQTSWQCFVTKLCGKTLWQICNNFFHRVFSQSFVTKFVQKVCVTDITSTQRQMILADYIFSYSVKSRHSKYRIWKDIQFPNKTENNIKFHTRWLRLIDKWLQKFLCVACSQSCVVHRCWLYSTHSAHKAWILLRQSTAGLKRKKGVKSWFSLLSRFYSAVLLRFCPAVLSVCASYEVNPQGANCLVFLTREVTKKLCRNQLCLKQTTTYLLNTTTYVFRTNTLIGLKIEKE